MLKHVLRIIGLEERGGRLVEICASLSPSTALHYKAYSLPIYQYILIYLFTCVWASACLQGYWAHTHTLTDTFLVSPRNYHEIRDNIIFQVKWDNCDSRTLWYTTPPVIGELQGRRNAYLWLAISSLLLESLPWVGILRRCYWATHINNFYRPEIKGILMSVS